MLKAIIENADKELIYTLCECVLNCINGNVTLDESIKTKLNRHKLHLRSLLRKRNSSIKKKKKILIQKGSGFLPIILSTILSALE
jgi:hypothetical protein